MHGNCKFWDTEIATHSLQNPPGVLQPTVPTNTHTLAPRAVAILCSGNNSLQQLSKSGKAQGYSHQFLWA